MALTRILIALCLFTTVFARFAGQSRHSSQAKLELKDYIENKKSEVNPRYRLHYHLMPPVGWMNDPNGFSYYNNEFHMFYQYYPYDTVWGPMHWGHSSSHDLVTWKELPTALLPEEEMCFSGSAVVDRETFVLVYTGRINHDDGSYNESQYLAYSDDGINFEKFRGNPILALPEGSPSDFRDPKVWKHEDYYYAVIGSTTDDGEHGKVVLYRTKNLISWEFLSVIGESGDDDLGYMWECPDFFEIDGKFVLLMSPQGLEPQGDRYKNIYQNGYIIGSFDYETFQFVPEVPFQELDYGHDIYAAQTTEKDGKRYVVGWFSAWEQEYPEAADGWVGALTLVREITLVGNRLLMKPVEAMESLRDDIVLAGDFNKNQVLEFDNTAEIILEGDLEQSIDLLIEGRHGGGEEVRVRWYPEVGKIAVERGHDDDGVRQVEWSPTGSKSLRLFLDTSSLELFCGEGEVVFSTRAYVDQPWKVTNLSQQSLKIESWHLKRSVPAVPAL